MLERTLARTPRDMMELWLAWDGDEPVSVQEWTAYFGELTGTTPEEQKLPLEGALADEVRVALADGRTTTVDLLVCAALRYLAEPASRLAGLYGSDFALRTLSPEAHHDVPPPQHINN